MTKEKFFCELMDKAKSRGYSGEDYSSQIGFILDGNNICSLMFDNNFNVNLFADAGERILFLNKLAISEDKWIFMRNYFKPLSD
jgi:hypothetical protein